MTTMDMTGRKVLITGAAGGLGTAITWAFARAGAQVHALDIDAAKGERLLAAGSAEAAEVRARADQQRGPLSLARH
jgi:3-oxoacyl-[acyl-carrier protein] reductase